MHKLIAAIASVALIFAFAAMPSQAGDTWSYPVMSNLPPFVEEQERTAQTYTSLDAAEVTKQWHICLLMPNMADAWYVAINFGAVTEAKRIGAKLTVFSAGGYVNLAKQISQLEDCVVQGADALLVFAISPTGLNEVIKEAAKKGIVIVDFAAGIQSPDIQARSMGRYYDGGIALAKYLIERHPKGSGKTAVLWLPGPAGAYWAEDYNSGFHDTLKAAESDIEVVATMYGDSHKEVQMKLVEDGLATYPDLKYIAGMTSGVESGVLLLQERGNTDIKLLSNSMTASVDAAIRKGTILGGVTDSAVMLPRIAIDQAVRILEGKELPIKDASPEQYMVDQSTVNTYDREATLPPEGYDPIFRLN